MNMITAVMLCFGTASYGGNLSTLVGAGGGGSSASTFMGVTTLTYTGDLGGIIGANAKCQINYASSHMCTILEFAKTGRATNIAATSWVLSDSGYMTAIGRTSGGNYTNYATYPCYGFSSASSTKYGTRLSTSGGVNITTCDNIINIACCK